MKRFLTMLALAGGLVLATFTTDIGVNDASAAHRSRRWQATRGWTGGARAYRRSYRPYAGYGSYGNYRGYGTGSYGRYRQRPYGRYGYGYPAGGAFYFGNGGGISIGW